MLTAGAYADEVSRYGRVWRAWGIARGSRVGLLSANRPEMLIAMGAALVTG